MNIDNVRRVHLVVDIIDDGADLPKVARDLLAGRRPDARVVDARPDQIAHPMDHGATQMLPPSVAFLLTDPDPAVGADRRVGFVLQRPVFMWARPVYRDPETWRDPTGLVSMTGRAEFDRLVFGGECRQYGFTVEREPGTLLEQLVDLAASADGQPSEGTHPVCTCRTDVIGDMTREIRDGRCPVHGEPDQGPADA